LRADGRTRTREAVRPLGPVATFVHHSAISGEGFKSLTEGAKVEYQVEDGPKAPQARDVSVVAPV
jgi:cold shock CspA family protein